MLGCGVMLYGIPDHMTGEYHMTMVIEGLHFAKNTLAIIDIEHAFGTEKLTNHNN